MGTSSLWQIDRPTLISVSGGRTSMLMLRRYLDHHGGRLPDHAVAVFCNTGREHPRTLDFVQRCSDEWACPIVWLEYQDAERPADRWRTVNHNSASRDGEPFAAVNRRKSFLPNSQTRTCTTELKTHCAHRWARAAWPYGQKRYVKAIGFRADEGHRVAKAQIRCGKGKDAWDLCWPLHSDGTRKADVLRWWSAQSFDLDIPERLGNCDLCMLKAKHKLAQNISEDPSLADWWITQEQAIGGTFRSPTRPMPSYADIREWALADGVKAWDQIEMDFDALDLDCSCTD